ncbi:MAG: transketolase C-terminal domain-containing protein [Acetobacter papayae]
MAPHTTSAHSTTLTSPPPTLSAQDALVLRLAAAARALLDGPAAEEAAQSHSTTELRQLCLIVTALWCRVLRYDPATPDWPDRDRFVVPSQAMLPLLRAMLHLSTPEPDTTTPLDFGLHRAVEIAPGPAGQGIAAAAGMALAEEILAARHGRSLVNHRTWVLARDSDLLTGIALEAAQLAGRFGLNRLAVLVCPAPRTDPADFSDSLARFSASGWSVRRVNARSLPAIMTALAATLRARKPTLLACLSDGPSPHPPMPAEEEQTGPWSPTARRGASARRSWLRRLTRHRARTQFEREQAGLAPPLLSEDWPRLWRHDLRGSSSQHVALAGLRTLQTLRPELAVLAATSGTSGAVYDIPDPHWPCGLQEHGMAGMLSGMALHGGILACGVAGMITIDRMRPALRMTALMRRRVLYLLTNDGLALSDGGGGWQPVEQLASLRAMPHLAVFRPANAQETFACWQAALLWPEGPALLVLCPHDMPDPTRPEADRAEAARPGPPPPDPHLPSPAAQGGLATLRPEHSPTTTMTGAGASGFGSATHGGYVLSGARNRQVTLIASGPEVAVAMAAARLLAGQGVRAAVVSICCWEVFARQTQAYRATVLGETEAHGQSTLRVGIEAASSFGWERWLGADGIFIGMDDFGISAPANAVYERFGITAKAVCGRVMERLGVAATEQGSAHEADPS